MSFTIVPLGYSFDALEPFIDAKTMEIHYSKHYQAYCNNLNNAISGTEYENWDIHSLVTDYTKLPDTIKQAVRNNAGGYLNHTFFWTLLKKQDNCQPTPLVSEHINKNFNSYEEFKQLFGKAAMGQFGSGWAWLVYNSAEKKLQVYGLPNQDNPLSLGHTPVLGLDVWEHAYYLKYQNRRLDYVNAFEQIINWEQVEKNLVSALS